MVMKITSNVCISVVILTKSTKPGDDVDAAKGPFPCHPG